MSYKIITLGGGMVGSAIARDLQEAKHAVTVADKDVSEIPNPQGLECFIIQKAVS